MTQAVLYNHTATLLMDGRVLVTGGQPVLEIIGQTGGPIPPAGLISAEIYDPSTGRWSLTGSMTDPRRLHGAVVLRDGMVLVSGGLTDEFTRDVAGAFVDYVFPIVSAEVYDPSTGTWSLIGDMPEDTVRLIGTQGNRPSILLESLENGKVLAVGGLGPSAALYDRSSNTWASAGGPTTSPDIRTRQWHTSALLGGGRVVYIGGWGDRGQLDSVELYYPMTGSSSPTGSLIGRRALPTAVVLADGRVLVTGGFGGGAAALSLASAEIYDPSSGTWSGTGGMATGRVQHTATLLSDGRVLVVGGVSNRATEIYDPSTENWSKAADTIERRGDGHTATLLMDGRVLVAGGASGSRLQPFDVTSAEVYDPVADTWTPSTEAAR